jgi:hypothetical protein
MERDRRCRRSLGCCGSRWDSLYRDRGSAFSRAKHLQPVFEDCLFHILLPFAAYAALTVSACAAHSHTRPALFLVAVAALLLLFVGIHNAWDIVTYHVFVKKRDQREKEQSKSKE